MDTRRLAIVVVNYGSAELLAENLVLTARSVPDADVVVVDNLATSSDRRRAEELSALHGWTLVSMPENMGFGGGANAGIELAFSDGATDVLLLNPDARIDGKSVDLLRTATANGTTVASPLVQDPSGRSWFSGLDLYLDDGTIRGHRRRAEHPGARRFEWLSGACLWIPADVWQAVGGFADGYFLYWEDVDFSKRVLDAGCRLALVEDAVAVHDEGGTHRDTNQRPEAKSNVYYYFNIRNRMLFATQHLDDSDIRRWLRTAPSNAWQVLLRGGRRQFLRGPAPLGAAYRGLRDGRRLARQARASRPH